MRIVNPLLLFFSIIFLSSSCYTFRGISIPPEVFTFNVENFDNRALEATPGLAQEFTLALKEEVK